MTKLMYPTNGIWNEAAASELVPADGVIPKGYTDLTPPSPSYKLKFVDGEWVETATQEEIDNWNTVPLPEPTKQDQINAQVIAEIAGLKVQVATNTKEQENNIMNLPHKNLWVGGRTP